MEKVDNNKHIKYTEKGLQQSEFINFHLEMWSSHCDVLWSLSRYIVKQVPFSQTKQSIESIQYINDWCSLLCRKFRCVCIFLLAFFVGSQANFVCMCEFSTNIKNRCFTNGSSSPSHLFDHTNCISSITFTQLTHFIWHKYLFLIYVIDKSVSSILRHNLCWKLSSFSDFSEWTAKRKLNNKKKQQQQNNTLTNNAAQGDG